MDSRIRGNDIEERSLFVIPANAGLQKVGDLYFLDSQFAALSGMAIFSSEPKSFLIWGKMNER